jgi:Flp pilus assembly protein TadD
MTRRHQGFVVITLVTVAAVAIGCGDKSKPSASKAQTPAAPAVGTTFVDDSLTKKTSVIPAGPVTFADGEAAFQSKNYAEATRVFTSYTAEHPTKAMGHYMLGLSSWKGGDLDGAEKSFGEALAIDPKHVKSLLNLSRVLLEHDRASDAVAKLMEADALAPDSGEIARLLGRAYRAEGKIDDAVASYRRAIELDENDSWAMNNLGLLFFEQGHVQDALPLFNRAVELNASVATFHNNLGMALEHSGRFDDAKAAYAGALEADAGYVKAQQNLARVEKVKVPKEPSDAVDAAQQEGEQPADASVTSVSR